jgi:hypothetical protein
MKVPDAWSARKEQLRMRGHCAICGKSTKKGDHSACSAAADRRRNEHAPGELSIAAKEKHSQACAKRKYLSGKLPKWMYS